MLGGFQQKVVELESKSLTPANAESFVFNVSNLPRGRRVAAFVIEVDASVTGSANPTVFRPEDLAAKFSFVEHNSDFAKVRADGYLLDRLTHHSYGKKINNAAQTYTVAAVATRLFLRIDLADPRLINPNDGAIPCELLNGKTIEVKTIAGTVPNTSNGGAQNITFASCVLRLHAILSEGAGEIDPLVTRIDYEDWGGQTALLKPGAFMYLGVYKANGQTTTNAEITRAILNMGGSPVIDNILAEMLIEEFNARSVAGGFEDNNAEQLVDTAYPFFPWVTPVNGVKVSALPMSETAGDVQAKFSGSATGARFYYKVFEFKSEGQVKSAYLATKPSSAPTTFERVLKTVKGRDPQVTPGSDQSLKRANALAKLLPGRLTPVK